VLAVPDAAEAIERAPAFGPEVALLDIGLPVMDGYELAAALRTRLSPPPVFVAVSGYGQTSDIARSAAEGFAGHLVKPIDAEQLQAYIAETAPIQRPASTGS
jgi:CheY-like chemotaxis protein